MNATAITLNVIFLAIFVVQFGMLIKEALTSTKTNTEMKIVSLAESDNPLRVSVCVSPGYNQTELEDAGYDSYLDYQYGQGRYNSSLIGWAGHTLNGQSKYEDAQIVHDKLTILKKLSDIVQSIYILDIYNFTVLVDEETLNGMVETSKHDYSHFCFLLKHDIKMFPVLQVNFRPDLPIDEAEIVIEDAMILSGRRIIEHSHYYAGPAKIIQFMKNCTICLLKVYSTELQQEVHDEEDISKHCSVYPNDQYDSYNDCDIKSSISRLSNNFGINFMPIWATNNISSVTSSPLYAPFSSNILHYSLTDGIQVSDCKMPCTTTKTSTIAMKEKPNLEQAIRIVFKSEMQITTTSMVHFNLIKFLSDVGGILGLWLGLGMVQLFDLVLPRVSLPFGCNNKVYA